jgi:uncharacterized protein YqgC (DUF456 family)
MPTVLPIVLLFACVLVGLVLVPLGLPGLWVMVLGVIAYGWLTDFHSVGPWLIALVLALAFAGEIVDWWLGFRFATKYGGSRRAGWGALIGGIVGAIVGVPVPVLGSIVGAFLGSFVGAAVFEYTREQHAGVAMRAGWGAMLGRAAAAGAKIALGLVIGVVGVIAVIRA